MDMQLMAEYSKKGMELLNDKVLKLGKGGLRWADGPNKGRLYELAKPVLMSSEKDGGQIADTLQKMASHCNALQKQGGNVLYKLDNLSGKMNLVAGLNVVNALASIANLTVDIAGFYIVCKKLDGLDLDIRNLSDKIDALSQRTDKQHSQELITKMKTDLRLFGEYKEKNEHLVYYINHNRDIESLLDLVSNHLYEMVRDFEHRDLTVEQGEDFCNTLALMLTLYSEELYEVNACRFQRDKKLSGQFEAQLDIFNELSGTTFQTTLTKYLSFNYPEVSPIEKANTKESINRLICKNLSSLYLQEKLFAEMLAQGVTSEEDLLLQPLDTTLSTEQIQLS